MLHQQDQPIIPFKENHKKYFLSNINDIRQNSFQQSYFSVSLHMLPNSYSFLDQIVKSLWDIRSNTFLFQDTEDVRSGNMFYLCNSMGITKDNT